MTTWLLVLFFSNGAQATLQQPFASRESCEIAAVFVIRRAAIVEAIHPERMIRLAHASCQPNAETQR